MKQASLDQVAQRLAQVHGPSRVFSGDGLRTKLTVLMNPYVNEALFADFVVVVEGEEDKALIEAYLSSEPGWVDVSTRAIAVVPVGGKMNLDKISAILGLLEIPHFLVFDRDGEGGDRSAESGRWNQVLGRLAHVQTPEAMPVTGYGNHHAVFAPTITEVVKQEMGPQEWTALRDAACSELGIEIHKDVVKNAEVLRRMLRRAARDGMSSPSLEAASRAIVAAVERDLIDPLSPMVK